MGSLPMPPVSAKTRDRTQQTQQFKPCLPGRTQQKSYMECQDELAVPALQASPMGLNVSPALFALALLTILLATSLAGAIRFGGLVEQMT